MPPHYIQRLALAFQHQRCRTLDLRSDGGVAWPAAGQAMAKLWPETINRHGGDATLVHLPEIGIRGNMRLDNAESAAEVMSNAGYEVSVATLAPLRRASPASTVP